MQDNQCTLCCPCPSRYSQNRSQGGGGCGEISILMLSSVFMLVIPADVLILLPKRKTMGVEVQVLHTEASFIRDTPPPGDHHHTLRCRHWSYLGYRSAHMYVGGWRWWRWRWWGNYPSKDRMWAPNTSKKNAQNEQSQTSSEIIALNWRRKRLNLQ